MQPIRNEYTKLLFLVVNGYSYDVKRSNLYERTNIFAKRPLDTDMF